MNQNQQSAEEFLGSTNLDSSFSPRTWFKLLRGQNFFRVIPPVHSLRKDGRISKYYATHLVKNAEGRFRTFQCIEDKDFKTKTIKQHCPFCDKYAENKKTYDSLKNGGASKEQLKAFNEAKVMPYQPTKKYYLNAINGAGEIGILPIAVKLHGSLVEFLKSEKAKGVDPTSVNGAYLNFSKQSAFDGDPNVSYSVALAMEDAGNGMYRVKPHVIDAAVLEKVKTRAVDLGNLYRSITVEQIARLVAADGDARKALVTEFFDNSKEEEAPVEEETSEPISAAPTAAPALAYVPTAPAATAPAQYGQPSAPAPRQAAPTAAPSQVVDDETFLRLMKETA
jgi:hypothetical protein